jgi:outer membrane receptor protein involved in Fe transport
MKSGILGMAALAALSMARAEPDVDMTRLSLKRIMDLDVTSVSKRTQKLRDVPTSVYVISEEDIKRSGATRLTDLLKLAPGAWIIEPSYTIQAQGVRESAHVFNNTEAWILDGVPITNPIIGGLFFNALDLPLEDIERIEIIKGPGGVIYGANSGSGVISIFTKRGEAAEGWRASLAGGTQDYLAPYVRYGLEAKDDLFLTFWGRFKTHDGYDRNPLFAGDSLDAPIGGGGSIRTVNRFPGTDDEQRAFSGGVKWEYQPRDELKWSGQVLETHVRDGQYSIQPFPWPDQAPADPNAPPKRPDSIFANTEEMDQTIVQARLDWTPARDDAWFLNAYHWRNRYDVALASGLQMGFDVSELEGQRNLSLARHRLSAGANVRRVQFEFADMRDDGYAFVNDPHKLAYLFGAFAQDEWQPASRWRLTAGAKAETWTLISLVPQVSPSLRLAYQPREDMTFWTAVSRSVTLPTYAQHDIEVRQTQIPPDWYLRRIPGYQGGAPAAGRYAALVPGSDQGPVDFYTVEAGHRGSAGDRVQWDLSGFYAWVHGALSVTPLDSTFQTVVPSKTRPGDTIVPIYATNLEDYESYGGEIVARWMPYDGLKLEASYSAFWMYHLEGLPIPGDRQGRDYNVELDLPRRTPHHVGRLRADCVLPFGFGLTLNALAASPFSRGEAFNYYEQLPASRTLVHDQSLIVDPAAPELQLDLSLRRDLGEHLTLSVWGRNILADAHVENYNQFGWVSFPHQVHRTFGAGLLYQY